MIPSRRAFVVIHLPVIASIPLKAGRGAGILSLIEGSRSYSVPNWARSIHPRRYAHDTSHYSYEPQSDASDASSQYSPPPKTWSHPRSRHPQERYRYPGAVQKTSQKAERTELDQPKDVDAASASTNTPVASWSSEHAPAIFSRQEIELDSKKPKRRPASKTVLNGGISHRERTERRAQLKHIEDTLGVRESQAMQRRFEKEDASRKEKRKSLIARLRPYIEKQLKLIELESEEQRKEVEARKTWSLAKLTKEGWALDGLEGFWLQKEKEKKGGQSSNYTAIRTAVLHRPGKARLGWTKVQKGDQVELKKVHMKDAEVVGSDEEDEVCSGTVRSINDNEVRINLEAPFHDLDLIAHPLWRIELAYNDLLEQRLKDAVEALAHDTEATQRAGAELSGSRLVEMLLDPGEESRVKVEGLTMAKWIKDNRRDLEDPDYGSLNKTQRQAIDLMLKEPISLIQGPPGTGKTSTIVAAIRILKQHYKIPHAVLLTSHTNVAVDNLAQGCKDAGLNVIRAGAMVKVRDSLNDVTVEGLMERHPSKPRLDELEANKVAVVKALQSLQDEVETKVVPALASVLPEEVIKDDLEWLADATRSSSGTQLTRLQRKLSLLMQKTFVLRREMEADIYRDVDVVCCTALSAPLIRVIDFPLVFFDEASMATEPVTIATMIKGCQQMSLIGDQQQLSPLIKSREVLDEGLGLSLFERLMERGDLKSVLLSTQHRMHPSLSEFPNEEFYAGRLSDAPATSAIQPIQSSYIKLGKHLSFVNHKGKERVTKNKSMENSGEADTVIKIIADVLCKNEDVSGSEIGIITPYLGQKELLWKSLQDPTSNHRNLVAKEIARLGGPRSRLTELNDIEIHTIDGFEGREKKVIIFSLVRANALKYLGFLKEEKRWNVALTRAKNALIIVGNASMLERGNGVGKQDVTEEFEEDIFLHRYADHLRQHDCTIDAKEVQQQQS